MTVSEEPGSRTIRSTKLAPGKTLKRLPWLDGKTSQAVSATPPEDDPSPTTRPSSRKSSVLNLPKRTATAHTTASSTVRPFVSAAIVRKKLMSSPTEHRLLATGSPLESSPSPVARHQMAQSRRKSVARQTTFHVSSVSHEPRKRLSVVDTFDPSVNEEGIHEPRGRADSLAPVPDHLERCSTSESIQLPVQRDVVTTTTAPVVISRVQMSPSRPRPGRNAFERMGNRRISNAIEDLEDMVQEAVQIADDTADHGQVEELYEIIEDARQAIQEASGDPARHLMTTSSPLPASGSSHEWEDYGGYPRDLVLPKPGKTPPLVIQRNMVEDPVDLVPTQVQMDLQQGPASVDWACQPHSSPSGSRLPWSRSTSEGRGRSRLGIRSDVLLRPDPSQAAPRELLLRPDPSQVAPRGHADFVLRPMARDHSRGRPHQRMTRDRAVRSQSKPCRHRRPQSRSSSDGVGRSRSAQHKRRSSSECSVSEESFDEEKVPSGQYGETLRVRDQVQQHTFSLRRHHRRQPIARNWGTGKKRLTAVIACINTALLGIMIGVYVSSLMSQRTLHL